VLEAQIKRRPAMKKVSTVTAKQSRNVSQPKLTNQNKLALVLRRLEAGKGKRGRKEGRGWRHLLGTCDDAWRQAPLIRSVTSVQKS
jgi:hypothetical protein